MTKTIAQLTNEEASSGLWVVDLPVCTITGAEAETMPIASFATEVNEFSRKINHVDFIVAAPHVCAGEDMPTPRDAIVRHIPLVF